MLPGLHENSHIWREVDACELYSGSPLSDYSAYEKGKPSDAAYLIEKKLLARSEVMSRAVSLYL